MTQITNSGSSLFSGFTGLFSRAFSGVGSICGKAVTIISSATSPITSRIPFSFHPITTRFKSMPKLGKVAVVVLTAGAAVAVVLKLLGKKQVINPAHPAVPPAASNDGSNIGPAHAAVPAAEGKDGSGEQQDS